MARPPKARWSIAHAYTYFHAFDDLPGALLESTTTPPAALMFRRTSSGSAFEEFVTGASESRSAETVPRLVAYAAANWPQARPVLDRTIRWTKRHAAWDACRIDALEIIRKGAAILRTRKPKERSQRRDPKLIHSMLDGGYGYGYLYECRRVKRGYSLTRKLIVNYEVVFPRAVQLEFAETVDEFLPLLSQRAPEYFIAEYKKLAVKHIQNEIGAKITKAAEAKQKASS